jgi:hypothetical protein
MVVPIMGMLMLVMAMLMLIIMIVLMVMIVRMLMTIMVMMSVIGVEIMGIVGVTRFSMLPSVLLRALVSVRLALMRLSRLRWIGACVLDDVALDALAIAAAARVAVARPAAVGTVFGFLFGLAMGAFVRLDQRLTIGDWNLIIIGVDFAEGQEAVAVAAILDKGRLQ